MIRYDFTLHLSILTDVEFKKEKKRKEKKSEATKSMATCETLLGPCYQSSFISHALGNYQISELLLSFR
ncbi:hypothetical protein AB3S75_043027 [Citrus x aurantiifolia]